MYSAFSAIYAKWSEHSIELRNETEDNEETKGT